MMRRVNEAWQVLGDRDARAVYDEVYFAWRTGSEQLAGELSGRLSMQQERRQARATSQEWTRWGREDRGRWGREQRRDAGAREREARGAGQSRSAGAGAAGRASAGTGARNERQQEPRSESGAGDGSDTAKRDDPEDAGRVEVLVASVLTAFTIVLVIVAIASS